MYTCARAHPHTQSCSASKVLAFQQLLRLRYQLRTDLLIFLQIFLKFLQY